MTKPVIEVDTRALISGVFKTKQTGNTPSEKDVEAYKAWRSGLSMEQVAAKFDIAESTAKQSVGRVEKWLTSNVAIDLAAIKGQQYLALSAVLEQAMTAWQKSSGKVDRVKEKFDENGKVVEREVVSEYKAGDPRFLSVAMQAMSAQREMTPGANAPKATAMATVDGQDVHTKDISKAISDMTEDELKQFRSMVDFLQAKFIPQED